MTNKQTDKQNEELLSIRAMAQVIIARVDKLIKVEARPKKVSPVEIMIQKRKISFYKNLEKRRLRDQAAGKIGL